MSSTRFWLVASDDLNPYRANGVDNRDLWLPCQSLLCYCTLDYTHVIITAITIFFIIITLLFTGSYNNQRVQVLLWSASVQVHFGLRGGRMFWPRAPRRRTCNLLSLYFARDIVEHSFSSCFGSVSIATIVPWTTSKCEEQTNRFRGTPSGYVWGNKKIEFAAVTGLSRRRRPHDQG